MGFSENCVMYKTLLKSKSEVEIDDVLSKMSEDDCKEVIKMLLSQLNTWMLSSQINGR